MSRLLAHLIWVLLVLSLLAVHGAVATPAERLARTVAITCCERAEKAWTILRSWQLSCAKPSARVGLSIDRYAAMLTLQARAPVSATVVSSVCEDGGLSRSAVAAYVRHALCASLPQTHAELARSVYSALMDEAPAMDDELTDDMMAACRTLQRRWVAEVDVWRTQLATQTELSAAQHALCPTPCRWTEDPIDGGMYDL